MISIQPVQTRQQQMDFIKFAWKIYEDDEYWVPPLIMDMKTWFSPKHPFYEYGEMQCFLAKMNNEIVGRIAAVNNPLYNEHQVAESTGFFGFFECIDNQEVANALFTQARTWLKNRGLKRVQGPASPSSNYDFGLLTKGFEDSPRIMMTYNPPYYENLIRNYGFEQIKLLYAYKIDTKKAAANERIKRGAAIAQKRTNVTIRKLRKKDLQEEMEHVKNIYNSAWEANWGHVPFTVREIDQLGNDLKLIADDDLLLFAEVDGKVIGKALAIPDYYYIQKKMNGKLFPFNFLKFFTQRKKITWLRVITLGIIPEYRKKGLDVLLCYELLKVAIDNGFLYGEGSWVLEDNVMMNRAMENISGEIYKHYLVFEMDV
jgi:GNAT superfamily N-acetyltransferase